MGASPAGILRHTTALTRQRRSPGNPIKDLASGKASQLDEFSARHTAEPSAHGR